MMCSFGHIDRNLDDYLRGDVFVLSSFVMYSIVGKCFFTIL